MTNKADVISLSLGGLRMSPDVLDTYTRTILNANRLGIPVVVAAGNDGSQTTGSPGNDVFAFTVGATDIADRPAGFSGGRTQVITTSRYIDPKYLPLVYSKPEVTAPGVDVYSAVPGGKWAVYNGTSMATPHVAGAMALLLSKPTALDATTSIAELSRPAEGERVATTADEHGEGAGRGGPGPPVRVRADRRAAGVRVRGGRWGTSGRSWRRIEGGLPLAATRSGARHAAPRGCVRSPAAAHALRFASRLTADLDCATVPGGVMSNP